MRTVFARTCICLLSLWLVVFVPVTVMLHHHPEGVWTPERGFYPEDRDTRGASQPGGACDVCARLHLPVDIDASRSFEILSEVRGISFNCNDIPSSSQLISALKDRSPPAGAANS